MPIIKKEGNFRLEKKKLGSESDLPNILAIKNEIEDINSTILTIAPFESGTKVFFRQLSAPTGWSIELTNMTYPTIKIVNDGSGSPSWSGSVGGSQSIDNPPDGNHNHGGGITDSTTLNFNTMGRHRHPLTGDNDFEGNSRIDVDSDAVSEWGCCVFGFGSGASHNHPINSVALDIEFTPKYLDTIVAIKD